MAYGNELTPSVIDAIRGNGGGNGYGLGNGDGILWLLLFIILGGGRGWGGNGGGYGAGNVGGNELYPWLNNAENINGGFRDQMLGTNINSIVQAVSALATQLCNCCGDMQMAVANGFNSVNVGMLTGFNAAETAANARQMANMQQQFASQTATQQGFNGLQGQLADCCCENRLATANQTSTLLADSAAKTQLVLDKLCQLELDGVKGQLAQAERENVALQNQLNMANLAASQTAQTAQILAGQTNEVDALYTRLNNCPVPSMPVYGRTPIFTCQQQNPYGCGCGCAA